MVLKQSTLTQDKSSPVKNVITEKTALLKFDIEGAEYEVSKTLRRNYRSLKIFFWNTTEHLVRTMSWQNYWVF